MNKAFTVEKVISHKTCKSVWAKRQEDDNSLFLHAAKYTKLL